MICCEKELEKESKLQFSIKLAGFLLIVSSIAAFSHDPIKRGSYKYSTPSALLQSTEKSTKVPKQPREVISLEKAIEKVQGESNPSEIITEIMKATSRIRRHAGVGFARERYR